MVVSSTPTIMQPRVRIPSTPSTFLSFYFCEFCNQKRSKINKKEAGIGPFLKKKSSWNQTNKIGGQLCSLACTLKLIHITAFEVCICGRQLHFSREIEIFLFMCWHTPLRKTQTAASSVNQPLEFAHFNLNLAPVFLPSLWSRTGNGFWRAEKLSTSGFRRQERPELEHTLRQEQHQTGLNRFCLNFCHHTYSEKFLRLTPDVFLQCWTLPSIQWRMFYVGIRDAHHIGKYHCTKQV